MTRSTSAQSQPHSDSVDLLTSSTENLEIQKAILSALEATRTAQEEQTEVLGSIRNWVVGCAISLFLIGVLYAFFLVYVLVLPGVRG